MEDKKSNKKLYIIIAVIIILLAIDQVTKFLVINKSFELIPNFLSINFEESIKGSFGVGQKGTLTFIITNVIVIGIIIKFMQMQSKQIDKKTYAALTMIIAGALGNLIDRIWHSYVIDFIYFELINFPIFNVADCFVTISCIGIIFLCIFKINEEDFNKIISIKRK